MRNAGVLGMCLAMSVGTAVAPSATTITWERAQPAVTPAPMTLTPGQVVLTRAPGNLPLGLTPEQLAVRLAQQERDLVHLQQLQGQTKAEVKEFATLQASLAQAQAEKEAIARSMAASTQHVATQTAATEARLREQLVAQNTQLTESLQNFTTAQVANAQNLTKAELQEYARLQAALAQSQAEKLTLAQNEKLQNFTTTQVANAQNLTKAEMQEYARLQAALAQALAEKEAMAASTQHVAIQAAATEARLREQVQQQNQRTTERLADRIRRQTRAERERMNSKVSAVEEALGARVANLDVRVGWKVANLAEEFDERLNSVNRAVADVSASRVKPEEAAQIAAAKVQEAKPEFQALALQTLGDAKPYLKTIARSAVADADPGMQQALGVAVGKALEQESSPAAFSMRRAIVNELVAATQGAVSPTATTRLGNDVEPGAGPAESVDAARLRLGRLLAPGAEAPTGEQLASLPAVATPAVAGANLQRARNRTDLMNLRDYKVVMHEDGKTLPEMLQKVLNRAEPFTGPWQVKWKISAENQDILNERFSLDVETTFDEFVGYLAQFLLNDRGIKISFSLFDRERIVLVSD